MPITIGSFAPLGLDHCRFGTHGLRRGLYACAAPRLELEKSPPCRKERDKDGAPGFYPGFSVG